MAHAGTNYLAVLIAAIASFVVGGVYYTVLSKQWMAALGKTRADMSGSMKPMLVVAVANLIICYVLAGAIGQLGPGQVTVRNGVISAAILWAGFVLTTLATNNAFAERKPALTLIDGGNWLLTMLTAGAVIGWLG